MSYTLMCSKSGTIARLITWQVLTSTNWQSIWRRLLNVQFRNSELRWVSNRSQPLPQAVSITNCIFNSCFLEKAAPPKEKKKKEAGQAEEEKSDDEAEDDNTSVTIDMKMDFVEKVKK